METLESSYNLIYQINSLTLTSELKDVIDLYIQQNKNVKGLANLYFRSNLIYIIENIKKPTLLFELKKLITL